MIQPDDKNFIRCMAYRSINECTIKNTYLETILETDESERTCSSVIELTNAFTSSESSPTNSSSKSSDSPSASSSSNDSSDLHSIISNRTAVLSNSIAETNLIGRDNLDETNNLGKSTLDEFYIRTSSPAGLSERDESSISTNNWSHSSLPRPSMIAMNTPIPFGGNQEVKSLHYSSSHGESGFDEDPNPQNNTQIKRSPGVVGVSELLQKTDNELEGILAKDCHENSISSTQDYGSNLPYDISPSWTPRHRRNFQFSSETTTDSTTNSLSIPSNCSLADSDEESSSSYSDNNSLLMQANRQEEAFLRFEDLPDDTLRMIQELSQQSYFTSEQETWFDGCRHEHPHESLDLPYIDSEDFYGEDWLHNQETNQRITWFQVANKADIDEITLSSNETLRMSCETLASLNDSISHEVHPSQKSNIIQTLFSRLTNTSMSNSLRQRQTPKKSNAKISKVKKTKIKSKTMRSSIRNFCTCISSKSQCLSR